MRSLLAAAVAIVALACYSGVPAADSEPVTHKTSFRVLKSGPYGRRASEATSTRRTQPTMLIATSDTEYRSLWREHIEEDPAPAVDFSRESVIFLLVGPRSSGGHAVTPKEAMIDTGVVEVFAPITSPGPDSIVTMAITYPYSVIAVPHPNLPAAEWRDADRVVARADRKVR